MPLESSQSSPRDSSPRLVGEAPGEGICAHCGLPAPEPANGTPSFCCRGCSFAYAAIHEAGLGAYYLHRGQADSVTLPALASERSYAEYDAVEFAERYVEREREVALVELFLEGIHCSACIWLVERLPRALPGVVEARFDLGRAALRVKFDPGAVSVSQIARALDGFGYPPHPVSTARTAGELRRDRALLTRLGVAGAIAGNVMLMALALYSGAFSGMAAEFNALFRWGSFALAIPSVFWCAGVFFQGAIAALRTRTPHMDLPVSIAILIGFGRSAWNTIAGKGEIYFDSIAILIFLLLVGRWLQYRHHRRATQAAELVSSLAPASARCVEGDSYRDLPAEAVESGATVEVRVDERIPVDGVVTAGSSSVDASWLTGESLPEDVASGARVYAGTRNLSATLRIRVEVAGKETRLGRLVRDVEEAQKKRAPIVRLADRIAGKFVLAVIALAALTLGIWLFLDPSRALDNAVALLVVTCPCALAMATPLAVSTALRRAAQAGILFKGGEFLEVLAHPATIAFDKTGTLTEGKLALHSYFGDPGVKSLVRAAEARSPHPVGRALVAAFAREPELTADSVEEQTGSGVRARVGGHEVLVGSREFVQASGAALTESMRSELERHAASGRSAVAAAIDGQVQAVLAFSDALRADAAESLSRLRSLGYQLAILSGDQREVVQSVAEGLGELREARGKMNPGDKLAWVEEARRDGPVVMIGDGVNDASAMSAADVGIAVHGGAEASLAAADAFTTEPGVHKVLEAVLGARRTLAVIHRGIAFSLAYNAVGVVLCLLGLISPLLAAVLMPLSSITVVSSALQARTFDVKRARENRR